MAMRIFVPANQKGGVGKSITSYNAAHYFARFHKKRTLFIDADEQGSASSSVTSHHSELKASDFFLKDKITLPGGRDFVVAKADPDLKKASLMVSSDEQRKLIETLRRNLDSIKDEFDIAVIDTPGSNSVVAGATLVVADWVLIPSIIDNYSLQMATVMIKRVMAIQKQLNPKLVNLGILPSLFDTMAPTQKKDLEAFLAKFSQFVLHAKISKKSAYQQAASTGIPIFDLKTTSGRDAAKEMKGAFDLIAEKMQIGGKDA